jgi:hypothetical protein
MLQQTCFSDEMVEDFFYLLPTWMGKGRQWLLNDGDSVVDLEKRCSQTLLNLYPSSQFKLWGCSIILMASLMIWDTVCGAEASIVHLPLGPQMYETVRILNRACPLKCPVFNRRSVHVRFVVENLVLRQVLSKYFSFPCQFSFHQMLHFSHLSSRAGTVGHSEPNYRGTQSYLPNPPSNKMVKWTLLWSVWLKIRIPRQL